MTFNNRLVVEADTILNEIGLLSLLEKYGSAEITGSYSPGTCEPSRACAAFRGFDFVLGYWDWY
ncbi:hypothetical protein ACFL0D_02140 [Thermoproteota archaeon]